MRILSMLVLLAGIILLGLGVALGAAFGDILGGMVGIVVGVALIIEGRWMLDPV
jgi:hypothetical protein